MLELILENRVAAYRIASVLLVLAMWRWGGKPERLIGVTFVSLFIVPTVFLEAVTDEPLIISDRSILLVASDVVACVIFVGIALQANRNYTLWVAGFQIVAMSAHMARGLADTVTPIAYAILVIGPSYFQLAIMLLGLIRHIRRKKNYGDYRDWRGSELTDHLPLAQAGKV